MMGALLHALLVALVAPAEATQTPETLTQIPIYSGAVAASAAAATPGEVGPAVRDYRVNASIDDVVKFYRQRLGAREGTADQLNGFYDKLKPGEMSPVVLEVGFVNLDELADGRLEGGHERTPKPEIVAKLKAIYSKSRTPYRPGQWVSSAAFGWLRRDRDGKFTNFTVSLEDTGLLDYEAGRLPSETGIAMMVEEEFPPEEVEADEEASAKPLLPEPSAGALGVPNYPGAKYDPRLSGDMSSEEAQYFIYTTADPPAKVTEFYERQIGKRAMRTEGGALIAVKGTGLFPELGLTIQPNMGTYPAAVKTMITVRRGSPGR